MKDDIRKSLMKLTENQAQLLKTIFESGAIESGASGLKGHGLGRIASSLQEQGFITPIGRVGRQYKWKSTTVWEDNLNNYREEIIAILSQVVGGYTPVSNFVEMLRVEFLKGALERLRDEVGTVFGQLEMYNRNHNRKVGFWASVRLLMPPIEAIAEAIGEEPWILLGNHLDVPAPHLVWKMFRNSLIHGDFPQHAVYGSKIVNWGISMNGNQHIIYPGKLHIDTKYLYAKLTDYLSGEIIKNDQTLIKVRVGKIYYNPPQDIVDDFSKL